MGTQPRPRLLSWLKTYSCSVRMKVFQFINGSSQETNKYYDPPAGDVTRVSMMPRKVTVKIGDAENRCR